MIPTDVGGFCKSHRKKEPQQPAPVVEQAPQPKKSSDVLPQKKEVLEDEIVDEDTGIIELPMVEEEEDDDLEEELEEIEEEQNGPSDDLVIQQIKLYYSNLPFLDQELPFEQQEHLSPQEWLNRINYIEEILKLGFYTTASLVEHVGTNWFSLRLQGYEQALRGNREVDEILKILKIKHLSSLL